MSQKNFTNATGNWIVSDTGEISYTGKVKIEGDLQANDFLDADGNSIVPERIVTYNVVSASPDHGAYTHSTDLNTASDQRRGKPLLQFSGAPTQSTAGLYVLGGASGESTQMLLSNNPDRNKPFQIDIDADGRSTAYLSGSTYRWELQAPQILLGAQGYGTTCEVIAEGTIQAADFLDADGNSIIIGEAPINGATYDRRNGAWERGYWNRSEVVGRDGLVALKYRLYTGREIDDFKSSEVFYADHATGDIRFYANYANISGPILANEYLDSNGNSIVAGYLKSVDEFEFDYPTEGPTGDVVSWSFNDTYNNVSSEFKISWGKRKYGPLNNVAEGHWIQSSPNGVGLHASKSDGSKESFYWANPAGYAQVYASTTTQFFTPSIALATPSGGTSDGEAAIKLKNNATSVFKYAVKAADFLDSNGNPLPKSATVNNLVTLTQAQYDALSTKDLNTIYFIKE